jgi:hypothetical protein
MNLNCNKNDSHNQDTLLPFCSWADPPLGRLVESNAQNCWGSGILAGLNEDAGQEAVKE